MWSVTVFSIDRDESRVTFRRVCGVFVRGVRLTYMGVVFAMVRDENCFVMSWSSFCGVRSFVCGA